MPSRCILSGTGWTIEGSIGRQRYRISDVEVQSTSTHERCLMIVAHHGASTSFVKEDALTPDTKVTMMSFVLSLVLCATGNHATNEDDTVALQSSE